MTVAETTQPPPSAPDQPPRQSRSITWVALGVAVLAGSLIPHLLSLRTGPWGNIGGTMPIFLTATACVVILIALWAAIVSRPQPLAGSIAATLALVGIAATLCWAQDLPIIATPAQRAAVAATKPPLIFGQGGMRSAPK